MKNLPLRSEAAQFALLRRLAPSLRHRLIGGMHPVSLLAELAGRRLAVEPPDLANARDAVTKIQAQARLAAASAIATIAWITGEESPTVALKEGVDACLALVRTDCEMRGAEIVSRSGDLDIAVQRRALRTVLTASVIAAVDNEPHPARIEVHARQDGDGVEMRVEITAFQQAENPVFAGDSRPLTWDDVEVLAQLEGVAVRSCGPALFQCRFTASATAPAPSGSSAAVPPDR